MQPCVTADVCRRARNRRVRLVRSPRGVEVDAARIELAAIDHGVDPDVHGIAEEKRLRKDVRGGCEHLPEVATELYIEGQEPVKPDRSSLTLVLQCRFS